MDWFRSDVGLRTHWSLPLLQQELGVNIREAAGIIRLFYDFVGIHADSGDLSKIPRRAVAAYIEWPIKKSDQLFDALIMAGLVSEANGTCFVAGWQDRNKAIFRHRERQRERREGASTVRARDSHGASTVRDTDSTVLDTDRHTDRHTNRKKKSPPTAVATASGKPTERGSGNSAKADTLAFVEVWNGIKSFRKCANLTSARAKKLVAHLKDSWWSDNWKDALKKAAGIAGLSGANERGWVANVDWFLRPDTVSRLVEGYYDSWNERADGKPAKPQSKPQPSKWDDPKWHTRQANIRKAWDRQKREAVAKDKPEPKPPQGYDPKWKPKPKVKDEDEKLPF